MSNVQAESPRISPLRLGRILLVTVPLAALTTAAAIAWGYFDVPARFQHWMLPPLVEVTGRVYLNSQPIKGGEVCTQPVGIDARGATAMTDDEGRFTLRTEVAGDFMPGAYVGEHRVIVMLTDKSVPAGPFKPPTITPPESEDFQKTPLRLTVDRDPSRNQSVEFRLEYTVPPRPAGKGKMPPAAGKGKMPSMMMGKMRSRMPTDKSDSPEKADPTQMPPVSPEKSSVSQKVNQPEKPSQAPEGKQER